ncbi:hypothetical protein [Deinococcus sp. UR1]|uniref:hypothetical protein n=1 Tax=Deinococcus sp. UR1 TaxID=1704277 RepID=UPI0011AF82FF|nr:hypothetical protein [Deinococcus sp. UR1]
MPSALHVLERTTPVTQALEKVDPEAAEALRAALYHGLEEFEAADRNDIWNVTARFWPAACRFTGSDREGRPGFGQTCLPSEMILPDDRGGVLRMVNMGHATVVVLISLVPYIRAGQELSVHALANALLQEVERVIKLGVPVHEDVEVLLDARHRFLSAHHRFLADTP